MGSPKLESLSKVLLELSEEVQRLEAEKAKYEDQEEAINTLNSNQTIIFILSATIIIMMVLLYWFFIKWTREDDRPVQISRSSSNLKMKTKNVDELRIET